MDGAEGLDIKLKWRRRAVVAGWVVGGTAVSLLGLALPFVLPALRRYCLPYVPATPAQVHRILSILEGRCGRVVDLGSGDGRVVSRARAATWPALPPHLLVSTTSRALR